MGTIFDSEKISAIISFCRSFLYPTNSKKIKKHLPEKSPKEKFRELSEKIRLKKELLQKECRKKDNQDPEKIKTLQKELSEARRQARKLMRYLNFDFKTN